MKRFVSAKLAESLVSHQTIQLPKNAKHHLLKVLRLKDDDEVELCDGKGNSVSGIISGKEIALSEVISHPNPKKICVVLSLIKSDRFRFALEKLAELGVTEIRPLLASRSQLKIPKNKEADKLAKWNLIAENATRQSGRYFSPRIYAPDFAENISKLEYNHIVANPSAESSSTDVENVALWIGPEGGFDATEMNLFKDFQNIHLSDAILRAETAAIVSTVLIKQAWIKHE